MCKVQNVAYSSSIQKQEKKNNIQETAKPIDFFGVAQNQSFKARNDIYRTKPSGGNRARSVHFDNFLQSRPYGGLDVTDCAPCSTGYFGFYRN